jgi:predicted permease
VEFLREMRYRVRSLFRRRALEAELEEEMALHRELLAEDARRAGVSGAEARRLAAVRFGNATGLRERSRDWWSFGWLEAVTQDVRYAGRFLRRAPGFTIVAVLSLALGIGANAAVFTVVDRLLFSPPPHVVDADGVFSVNVRRIYRPGENRPFHDGLMFPEVLALRESASSFAAVVPYTAPSRVRLGRGPDAPRVKESMVAGDFFHVLGVRPVVGRFFTADDLRPDATERSGVISHGFWERHFSASPGAVGARLTTSGMEFVVVGVAPPGFTGVALDAADVWVPLEVAAPVRIEPNWKTWDGFGARAVVRLREGVGASVASAEATAILRRLPEERPVEETVELGSVIPGRTPAEQPAEVKVAARLAIASALVLLAACANLANLLLVRALTRRRELALRMAVGISRRRLVGQLVAEALLIAAVGAGLALIAARWGGAALRALVFPQIQWASATLDHRVLIFSTLCGTVVALLATVAPAIRMTRSDVATALRSAAPQLTQSTGRLRRGLLALQVALSVMLIVGAVAFGQSLRRAYAFDMGIDLDRVVVARLFLEEDSISAAGRRAMLEEAARRARRLPGVERVALAERVPLAGNAVMPVSVPGHDSAQFAVVWEVTPDLQPTLGFRLERGRWILPEDTRGAPVALVTVTMARRLWPGDDAIGTCARFGSAAEPCRIIVGVVRDLRQFSIRDEAPMAALLSTREADLSRALSAYVVVRTSGRPEVLVRDLHEAFRDLRPDLATLEIKPLAQALDRDYRPLRLGTAMFFSFALLAVMLAGVGLFGILAFSVAQRTGELGVRAALGANVGDLLRLVLGEGMAIVAVGFVLGGAFTWYGSPMIDALLFDTSARTAAPYGVAAAVLGVVALVASAVPAWRATKVDPAIALRAE